MNKKKAFLYLVVLAELATLTTSCQETPVSKEEHVYERKKPIEERPAQDIRILLLKNVKEARLAIHSPYKFSQGNTILAEGNILPEQLLRYTNGEFSIGEKALGSGQIQIVAQGDGAIELNGVRYHGNLLLLPDVDQRKGTGKFFIIEITDIESYIAGVIGSEMPYYWSPEALRAQAIVARTFAAYQRKKRGDAPYHTEGISLAYQGLKNAKKELNIIVEETRGMAMLYNNEVFPAYFHSTCGGRTEDANLIFHQDSIPPLRGVSCGFCSASKYYDWQTEIDKTSLEKKLRSVNSNITNIYTIQPVGIGPGNHSSMVQICYAGGTEEMNANEFRLLMGSENVRSTAFNAESKGHVIKFSGRGWGHGVGLCQYGAQGMAEKGYKWSEILKYYYPEIEIKKIY
ncbi:MAG TPA: SpoIID/LytB domain-containing protein [Candidatus Brocadiales bacterium]|nr:SpoIID/LytB domain-containing protein [Candidatus Brocadiales bacterium]